MTNTTRINSQQRKAMTSVVLAEELKNIKQYFNSSVYSSIRELIDSLGEPYKCKSNKEDGITQIYFRNSYELTVFAWGGNSPESVFKEENSFKSDYLHPDIASQYLENTEMHAFYATCLNFQEMHKHTSIFAMNAQNENTIPEVHERWICLSYIGKMYNVCITKRAN